MIKPIIVLFMMLGATTPFANASESACAFDETWTESGWRAYALTTTEDAFTLPYHARDAVDGHALFHQLYDAQGRIVRLGGTLRDPVNDGARIRGIGADVDATLWRTHQSYASEASFNSDPYGSPMVGEFTLLVYAAGELREWGFKLCGPGVSSVEPITSGTGTFALGLDDFDVAPGSFDVDVRAGNVGARAQRDVEKTLQTDGVIVGTFIAYSLERDLAIDESSSWVESSAGREPCPCLRADLGGADAWDADAFTFHVSSTGLASQGVLLAGALLSPAEVTAILAPRATAT